MTNLQPIDIKEVATIAWNNHWNAEKMKHLRPSVQKTFPSQEKFFQLVDLSPLSGVFVHDFVGKRGFCFDQGKLMRSLLSGETIYGIGG